MSRFSAFIFLRVLARSIQSSFNSISPALLLIFCTVKLQLQAAVKLDS